ncbi:MAG TPA: MarR family transcriptional regulator [Methylomirabilota bacterium]|nr:MarR family transcriptional regulator [Methylomirabilota bacterium]
MGMSTRGRRARDTGPWIGSLLRHAWESVRRRIYQTVVAAGYADLTGAHVGLFRFESLEGSRPSRLAEQMSITKQSVNDLLRDLERRGYLVLRPDPSDRRARLVRLTARGRRLDAAVRAAAREAEREIRERLGEARFTALREALLDLRGPPGSSARPGKRAGARGPRGGRSVTGGR